MQNINYKLNVSGLLISDFNLKAIHELMDNLSRLAPSDSQLSLCIVNGEHDVNAFLSISSRVLKLEFTQHGSDPLRVSKLLSQKLLGKIKNWKSSRF